MKMVKRDRTLMVKSTPCIGRIKILVRLFRFALMSMRRRYYDFLIKSFQSFICLIIFSIKDVFFNKKIIECNICGWAGNRFYRHTGSGYDEFDSLCPGCLCQDRHRSLLFILQNRTDFFGSNKKIIEVAPERKLEQLFSCCEELDYVSFDINRHAMEKGDITSMRYGDETVDIFLCLHVLEHIPDEQKALSEIYRVIKRGGFAILQVPIDWDKDSSVEYSQPNPKETYHVRRYGKDFPEKLKRFRFDVSRIKIDDYLSDSDITKFGCSKEPFFLLKK